MLNKSFFLLITKKRIVIKGNKSVELPAVFAMCKAHAWLSVFFPPPPTHGECNPKSIPHVLRCTSTAQVALPQKRPPRSIRPRQHQKHLNHFSGRDWSQMERKGRKKKRNTKKIVFNWISARRLRAILFSGLSLRDKAYYIIVLHCSLSAGPSARLVGNELAGLAPLSPARLFKAKRAGLN